MVKRNTLLITLYFFFYRVIVFAQGGPPGGGGPPSPCPPNSQNPNCTGVDDVLPIDDYIWIFVLLAVGLGVYYSFSKRSILKQ